LDEVADLESIVGEALFVSEISDINESRGTSTVLVAEAETRDLFLGCLVNQSRPSEM
jgi:hypothetical protein